MTIQWKVGQRAVISRTRVVTIERVTPAGRVIADGRTFNADGSERSSGAPYNRPKLEPFTPEIQAEMDLVIRGRKAANEAIVAVEMAEKWLRRTFSSWGGRSVPDAEDVEKAEKLTAAIQQVLGDES